MYKIRESIKQKINKLDNTLTYWPDSVMALEEKRKLLIRLREIERVIAIEEEAKRRKIAENELKENQ
jgi:hypothetical protein